MPIASVDHYHFSQMRPRRTRSKPRLTREALALVQQAEAGGVPAFVSQNLRRIAEENGVEITDDTTPNDIVDALRSRATL